jgi:DUF1680 family protein
VKLTIAKAPPNEHGIFLRIPGWAGRADFKINGKPAEPAVDKGYAFIRRHWAEGDVIDVSLPLAVQRLEANPNVLEDRGRVALRRGPFIYCFEQGDNQADIDNLVLPPAAQFEARYEPGMLKGVSVITGRALVRENRPWDGELYRPASGQVQGPVTVRAVPYCTWANRGLGKMAVWVEESR